ncbi:hypothetical protein [Piscinibacter sp.]|uniref:hypothetical protein n=1 Tax=Piscinibacter sp. TaxID=1903157 RepID=UPI002C8C04E5|nr:hypothetical protein [Albitalea sp.]HUG22802.1 hypothetical protein [Albitalea sp.]
MPALRTARRAIACFGLLAAAALSSGCTTTMVVMYAYDKFTEGDPTPCHRLNSVERALSPRCGPYEAGTLVTKDVNASGLPQCPLSIAARDPRLWPALPELLAKGALPEVCDEAPLAALARATPCPDFSAATPESLVALRWLAEADARAIQHDVVRLLSCPAAHRAGLSTVLDSWLAQGLLPARGLAFGPLGALHPQHLDSPLAHALEAQGHTAQAALGSHDGKLPGGFDEALRHDHRAALDWWLDRVPDLANRVPSTHYGQFSWIPLARVITPSYIAQPEQQLALVEYLMSRGADPWNALPHDAGQSVVSLARRLNSPALALLDTLHHDAAPARSATVSSATVGASLAMPMSAGPAPLR